MQRLQCDLRFSAAIRNGIPHAAASARNLAAAVPLRSAQMNGTTQVGIATRYCRTHRFDAPVPMHKVCQHMQNTIAQHQQRRKKSPGTLTVTLHAHFDQDSTANRRCLRPSRARAYFSPQQNLRLPEKKHNVSVMFRANPNVQIASMM